MKHFIKQIAESKGISEKDVAEILKEGIIIGRNKNDSEESINECREVIYGK